MSDYEKIRLPVEENGETVNRTLEGKWLVGMGDRSGRPALSSRADYRCREQWDNSSWFVIRSASGKLVVYRQPLLDREPPASVTIFDSFEAMQAHVPPNIYDTAMEKAGLKPPQQFTELPLEGV